MAEEEVIQDEGIVGLPWNVWFCETHRGMFGLNIRMKTILHSEQSEYNKIDIVELDHFGRALVLYNSLMSTEKDEHVYHEMISHVPLFLHPNPKRVLIIGGGEGATLRECVKHPGVEEVIMCEIDQRVVELSREYLPQMASELDNPKAKLVYDDGAKFLDESSEKFDLVIVDGPDPVGPGVSLFQKSFHQRVFEQLTDNGMMVQQTESPMIHAHTIKPLYRNFRSVFPHVHMYMGPVLTYPGIMWSWAFCSKTLHPIEDLDPARVQTAAFKDTLKWYSADVHKAAFAIPPIVQRECLDD